MASMQLCPCGNSRPLEACCGRFISGQLFPETAEELMRSRYTAYATGATAYVLDTQDDNDRERVEQWAKQSEFLALRVLSTQLGEAKDQVGQVEFEADYKAGSQAHTHREVSHFERRGPNARWIFLKGHPPTQTRSAPKVGRNEPCPCGSGKKLKKCCGAA